MPPPAKLPTFLRRWAPAALSAGLAIALYAVTIRGTYVYDDIQVVKNDPRVHNPHQWAQLWTGSYVVGAIDNLYRPLVSQSYALQWWLHGDKPWAFHLVNVLLHALVAALVAELALRLTRARPALLAGLLFAAHPIHVEAVAEIVGRADLACTAALLGAMILFVRRPMTSARAIAIGALGIIAMLCKESGMLLPPLLLVLAICNRYAIFSPSPYIQREGSSDPPAKSTSIPQYRSKASDEAPRRAMLWLIAIVGWSTSAFIVLREQILKLRFEWDTGFLDWTIQPMIRSHGIDRLTLPLLILGRYLRLIACPSRLSIDYGVAVIGSHAAWSNDYVLLGISNAIAWLLLVLLCIRKRWGGALFCLLGIAVTYAMISNVILIGTVFGERLMYLPSVFIFVFAGIALARLPRALAAPLLVAALALASLRTVTYAASWIDKDDFYQLSLDAQPRSVRLHLLVAQRAYELGDLKKARSVMADACQVEPAYWDSWLLSAQIEQRAGDWPLALRYAHKAFDVEPNASTAAGLGDAIRGAAAATQPSR